MIPKLTHTEACKMVEDALERVGKTLAYIRLRLAEDPYFSSEMKVKGIVEEANILCNINNYGSYMKGAMAMFSALEKSGFLDIPKPKGLSSNKEDRIINKAQLKLYLESQRNLDWFLHGEPNSVQVYTEIERDRKGKVIGARARFVKKEIKYKEI